MFFRDFEAERENELFRDQAKMEILRKIFSAGLCLDIEGGQLLNLCGNSSQTICPEDREVWIGSGSFSDPFRTSAAMMQTVQRRKRQNCGSSAQGHQSTGLGGTGQLGLGVMVAEESLSHLGPVFPGAHRAMNQGGTTNSRSLEFNGFEPGNCTNAGLPFNDGVTTDGSWNALSSGSTLQQPVNNSVGSANSSYTHVGDHGRHSHKRKSSMDSYPGSLTHATSSGTGENNFLSFIRGPGARRSDTPLSPASGIRRDGQGAYHSFRTNALPVNRYDGLPTTWTQDNYYCPSVVRNERGGPRRLLSRSDSFNESIGSIGVGHPETLPFRQGNGLSATRSWQRNSPFSGGSNHFEMMGNFNPSIEGNILRLGETSAMIDIARIDTRPHQPTNRATGPAHFRELNSQSSHLSHHLAPSPYAYGGTANAHASFPAPPPYRYSNTHTQAVLPTPGSAITIAGLASGPQAAFGDVPSGSLHGQFIPRYNDTSRATLLRQQASLRGSRVLLSNGVNRHRFSASHHSLAYEWADAYDQHSDMRLDVDNMSYEELLALEERIGDVKTGLDDDNIQKCLKVSIHSCSDVTMAGDSEECELKCSICQEEYTEGDELGELQCGHGYHTDCVKQWLLLKNICPICKAAAC